MITTTRARLLDNLEEGVLCQKRDFARDEQGLVSCQIFWSAEHPEDAPAELAHCDGFLQPAGRDERGSLRCRVNQVPVQDGEPAASEGFYYLSDLADPNLPAGSCNQALRYTAGVHLPPGARADLVCTTALKQGPTGENLDVSLEQCAPSAEALAIDVAVGQTCVPSPLPLEGFSERSSSVSAAANGCGGSPCLVYQLEGNPAQACTEQASAKPEDAACVEPRALEEAVYCSCRCGLQEGTREPSCECPSGFTCAPAIADGPVAGSYCVRSASL